MTISDTVQKNKLFVYQGSIIAKMKMPLYLKLVDNVYEPKQLQPTPVPSLSPPKPMTYTTKTREALSSNR